MKIQKNKNGAYIDISDVIIRERQEYYMENFDDTYDAIMYYIDSEYGSNDLERLIVAYSKEDIEKNVEKFLSESINIVKKSSDNYELSKNNEIGFGNDKEKEEDKDINTPSCILGRYSPQKTEKAIEFIVNNINSSNEEDVKQAKDVFYVFTVSFVHSEINKIIAKDPSFLDKLTLQAKNVEDLVNDIYIDAYKKLPTYSIEKSNLITFIKQYINKGIHDTYRGNLNNNHNYAKTLQKCSQVDELYRKEGHGQPTLLDYYIFTEISLTTISHALKISQMSRPDSLEDINEKGEQRNSINYVSNIFENPEKQFLNKELSGNIIDAVIKLDSPQREVFILKNASIFKDFENLDSCFDVLKECDGIGETKRELIHQIIGIPAEKVDEYYRKALNSLQSNKKFVEKVGRRVDNKNKVKKGRIALFDSFDAAYRDMEAMIELEEENLGYLLD